MKNKLLIFFLFLFAGLAYSQPTVFSAKPNYLGGVSDSNLTISLSSLSSGAQMYYTIDGTIPDSTSLPYIGPIHITGDGTHILLRTIAIDSDSSIASSYVYSSYYEIESGYDSSMVLGLTTADYQNTIAGDWIGTVTAPWVLPYNIHLNIQPSGHYLGHSISPTNFLPFVSEHMELSFYYGSDVEDPSKYISIDSVNSFGVASGNYMTYFSGAGSITTDTLRTIELHDNGNVLQMEMWHFTYGPILLDLTRVENLLITGLEQNKAPNELRIYPNPSTGSITIASNDSGINEVKIIDLLGNEMISFITTAKNLTQTLDLSAVAKGVYLVQIIDANNTLIHKKIVLQ